MSQVQSHNNNGLFRTKKYSISRRKKQKHVRLVIRRSKIYHSMTNNSSPQSYSPHNNFTVHYRPQSAQLRYRRIKRTTLNGAGDENIVPSVSNEQKHIDFTELEHIFDNAIRNRLPLELYTEKPFTKTILLTPQESFHPQSLPKLESTITNNPIDTRIELSNQTIVQDNNYFSFHQLKQHKILVAFTAIIFSALIGFSTVLIFIK